jgi:ABC-type transport system involved in cytochrome c biogenesis, permease component
MALSHAAKTWWWLVHKDLLRELRAPRAWPAMLILSLALAMVISVQIDSPSDQHLELAGGMFWLAAFFAGTVALDRSFSGEHEQACWQGLLLYPVGPGTLFLAKLAANFLAFCALDVVLVPAFTLLSGVSLFAQPGPFLATALVANLGFSAVGTLVSALTSGLSQRHGLLVLLLFPLVLPVVLGAVQATRAMLVGDFSSWWRWIQLLSCFAAVFVALGTLIFDYLVED